MTTAVYQNLVLRCLKVLLQHVLLENHVQHFDVKQLVKEIDEFVNRKE